MSIPSLKPGMRRVYRIQNDAGKGAYNVHWGDRPSCCVRHPGPGSEPGLDWYGIDDQDKWYFGFATMKQLHTWFYQPGWLEMMHEAGLRLTVWEVPLEFFRYSKTQAIFVREEATKVATMSLIDFTQQMGVEREEEALRP